MRPAARTRRCARRSSRAASSSRRRSGTAARRSRSSSPSPTPLHSSGLACPGVSGEAIDLIERLLQARLARLDGTRPGTRPEVDGTRPEVDAGRGGSRGGSPALSPAPPRGEGVPLGGGRLIKPASSSPPLPSLPQADPRSRLDAPSLLRHPWVVGRNLSTTPLLESGRRLQEYQRAAAKWKATLLSSMVQQAATMRRGRPLPGWREMAREGRTK